MNSEPANFSQNTDGFYRPKLTKVSIYTLFLLCCLLLPSAVNGQPGPSPAEKVTARSMVSDQIIFTESEKAWLSQGHVVHARVGDAPPLHFDENGLKGMSIDYFNLVAQRAGFRVEYITGVPWSKALQDIQGKKNIDLILTAQVTPERKKFLAFTKTYIQAPTVIFNRTDSSFVGDIEDLYGKTVVVEQSYLIQKLLAKRYPQITIRTAATSVDALKLLATGDADAYLGSLLVGTYLIKAHGLINLKVAAPAPFNDTEQSMGIRDDWPELASIIDKTLATITPEEHTVISDRWLPPIRFEYGISYWDVSLWITGVGVVMGTIILAVIFWNKRLAAEVLSRCAAEKANLDLMADLNLKNQELERFIYTVSHDLKSPLVTVNGFCDVAKEDFASGDHKQGNKSLEMVSNAAKRMRQLLNELLHLSRVGVKTNPSEIVSLDVLIKEAIKDVSGVISENNTTIEIEPGLPDVSVDKQYLLQVLENILTNASKYSNAATGGSKVKIGVIRKANELICYFKDNGIGIEAQYLDKVFGLFEKLDSNSNSTGVGLAIVKRIIENHGGRIWAESEGLGHGTTVFFTLPEAKQ